MDNQTKFIKEHFRKTQLVPYCIIMVIGILANTTVIVNGIRRRSTIRHYSNYFVLSMAFADLGVVVYQVPIAIVEYTFGLPNMTQFTCKYVLPTRETFQGAAIFSVSVLAFIRARQVMSYPNKKISRCTCIILIVGIWLVSYVSCSLPLYFVYKVSPSGQCDAYWTNDTLKNVLLLFIAWLMVLPMIISTISYGYIIVKIRNTFTSFPNLNDSLRRRNRNVKMLLICLMLSCWISYVPMAVFIIFELYTDVNFYVWSIASILYVNGSALNPVLVLLNMSREYCCQLRCWRVPRVTDAALNLPKAHTFCMHGFQPSNSRQSMNWQNQLTRSPMQDCKEKGLWEGETP
jgi:hypothetical protein